MREADAHTVQAVELEGGRARRRRSARRGSQALEFAVTAPLLGLILAGIVDYSWYFSQRAAVVNATRDAARSGSIELAATAPSEAQNTGMAALANLGLDPSKATIAASVVTVDTQAAIRVSITVDAANMFGLGLTPPQMSHQLTMRLEQQP